MQDQAWDSEILMDSSQFGKFCAFGCSTAQKMQERCEAKLIQGFNTKQGESVKNSNRKLLAFFFLPNLIIFTVSW